MAVFICIEAAGQHYKRILNKDLFEVISIEDMRVKIKESKAEDENAEDKPISNQEVFE